MEEQSKEDNNQLHYWSNVLSVVLLLSGSTAVWYFSEDCAEIAILSIEYILTYEANSMSFYIIGVALLFILVGLAIVVYSNIYFWIGFLLRKFLCKGEKLRLIYFVFLAIGTLITTCLFSYDIYTIIITK